MLDSLRKYKPSPAMFVALIALIVALSGTAVAATLITGANIKDGTITSADIKNNTIKSIDVRNGALGAVDLSAAARAALKGNTGPAGATGAQGPAGATGAQGPGAKWILVSGNGTRIAGSTGVSVASKPFTGEYRIDFGEPTSGKLVLASVSERDNVVESDSIQASPCGVPAGPTSDGYANCTGAANANRVAVIISDSTTAAVDRSFYVALIP